MAQETDVRDAVDLRNVDQNNPFSDMARFVNRQRPLHPPVSANRHKKEKPNFVYTLERSQLSE